MNSIKLLSQTPDTVTLRRKDFETLLQGAEDRADLAAVAQHRAHEREVGWAAARRDAVTDADWRDANHRLRAVLCAPGQSTWGRGLPGLPRTPRNQRRPHQVN